MKAFVVLAAVMCACPIMAAAQQPQSRVAKHPATTHEAPPPQPIAGAQQTAFPTPSVCDVQLGKIAVVRPLGALVAPGGCGAPDAVLLSGIELPNMTTVVVTPPATLRCTMATAVARWVRKDVAPAAAANLGAPLRGLENLASYDCRTRDHIPGAKLSEHARANALDVRSFKLANGVKVVLADPNVPRAFRDAVRDSACARFMTVLGPGSDGYHSEHVHIDLEPRRNNYKICEWDVGEPEVRAPATTTAIPLRLVPLPLLRPAIGNVR
jgi:hypothetical protein